MACPNPGCSWDWCSIDCDKLKIGRVKACSICVKDLSVDGIFSAMSLNSPNICGGAVVSDKLDANKACLGNLGAKDACIQNLNANNAKLVKLVVNDLCIAGSISGTLPLNCSKYEATAVYSTNTSYALGSFLDFNNILSNPSGALVASPSAYHAPVDGNYIVMLQIDQQNLVPSPAFGPLLGVPVANPQLILNGVIHRELYASYLTFFNQQRSTLTALVKMNKNDVLQFKYKVLALNQASGVSEVVGTVDILGNGSADDQSIIKIELLSVNCPQPEPPQPVVPCDPVLPCAPCTPAQCNPSSSIPCGPCAFESK